MRWIVFVVLLALATPARAESAFERGVALFQAGKYAASLGPLAAAHAAAPTDVDTALLLGIAYYETGDLARARPLLEQVERSGDPDGRASARVFLGLIADAAGQVDRARTYYALVAHSQTELGPSGRLLLEQSGTERWMIAAIMRPGFDSNVPLLPATATGPGTGKRSDADLTLIVTATARPIADLPLVVDETATYRKQAELTDYDLLGDVLGGTLVFADRCNHGTLAYHLDASLLGGTRFDVAHVADAGYRRSVGGGYGVGARYAFAAHDYAQDAYAGYSGLYHTATAEASWGAPTSARELVLGYVVAREATDDGDLAVTAHGPIVTGRVRAHGSELRTAISIAQRWYGEDGRRDLLARGEAMLVVDISRTVSLVLGATAVHNGSTIAADAYDKWTVFGGVIVASSS